LVTPVFGICERSFIRDISNTCFYAFVITSNPSLKDESISHAEQLKTEIRKTNGMKVIGVATSQEMVRG